MNQNIDITQLLQMAAAQRQQVPTKGLSYWEVLSVALVILKATECITMSWFWAFFPIFIPYIFYLLVISTGIIIKKFNKK